MTVVFRAIGNVSAINVSRNEERFRCETDFACNEHTLNDVKNRYMQCSLVSPVEQSDDGRTLRVLLDDREEMMITMTGEYGQVNSCPTLTIMVYMCVNFVLY